MSKTTDLANIKAINKIVYAITIWLVLKSENYTYQEETALMVKRLKINGKILI